MPIQHVDLADEPPHLVLQQVRVVVLERGVRIHHHDLLPVVRVEEEVRQTD